MSIHTTLRFLYFRFASVYLKIPLSSECNHGPSRSLVCIASTQFSRITHKTSRRSPQSLRKLRENSITLTELKKVVQFKLMADATPLDPQYVFPLTAQQVGDEIGMIQLRFYLVEWERGEYH